jgi:hypothetical protein
MDQNDLPDDPEITTGQARNLYISHLLSTWNARTYEFASVSHSIGKLMLQ